MSAHLHPIPWLAVLLILVLVMLNGVLSMSELAIVSSREARLKALARNGSRGARTALDLASDPGRFLSTVQSGITLITFLNGAFSGATLGEPAAERMQFLGLSAETAHTLGFIARSHKRPLAHSLDAVHASPTRLSDVLLPAPSSAHQKSSRRMRRV